MKIFVTAILLSDFLITIIMVNDLITAIIQDLTSSKSTFVGETRWSDNKIRVRVNK